MLSLLIFLAVLSVLVLGHEFGHYIAARLTGVKAEEFGYGFPPRAIGFVRNKGKWKKVSRNDEQYYESTIWSLNWLPLGGFVRLKGEQGELAHDRDSFATKGTLAKLFILCAGVVMNWLLAAAIFSFGFSLGVPMQTDQLPAGATVRDPRVQIDQVTEGSAAQQAGIKAGDIIRLVDRRPLSSASEVVTYFGQAAEANRSVTIEFERQGERWTKEIMPTYLESVQRKVVGVVPIDVAIVKLPIWRAVIQGVQTTAVYTRAIFLSFGELLKALVGKSDMQADVAGPVGIAVITGKIASEGWWPLLQFAAILSINLAIINFLPIPALDGGRVLFVLIEAVRRKKNNAQIEATVHQIGFIVLLILVALVTLNDLRTYGGTILHGLKGIVGL